MSLPFLRCHETVVYWFTVRDEAPDGFGTGIRSSLSVYALGHFNLLRRGASGEFMFKLRPAALPNCISKFVDVMIWTVVGVESLGMPLIGLIKFRLFRFLVLMMWCYLLRRCFFALIHIQALRIIVHLRMCSIVLPLFFLISFLFFFLLFRFRFLCHLLTLFTRDDGLCKLALDLLLPQDPVEHEVLLQVASHKGLFEN